MTDLLKQADEMVKNPPVIHYAIKMIMELSTKVREQEEELDRVNPPPKYSWEPAPKPTQEETPDV